VAVSTYNFWGCKDIKEQPKYEKLVGKIPFFVEKLPEMGPNGKLKLKNGVKTGLPAG
jgi:hypothetical protein